MGEDISWGELRQLGKIHQWASIIMMPEPKPEKMVSRITKWLPLSCEPLRELGVGFSLVPESPLSNSLSTNGGEEDEKLKLDPSVGISTVSGLAPSIRSFFFTKLSPSEPPPSANRALRGRREILAGIAGSREGAGFQALGKEPSEGISLVSGLARPLAGTGGHHWPVNSSYSTHCVPI